MTKIEKRETAYNLRDSENKLNVLLLRTNYYKHSFSYSGAILWNSVPCDLRVAESLGQFKRLSSVKSEFGQFTASFGMAEDG